MYADDTNAYVSSNDVNECTRIMNEELRRVTRWLQDNCLSLNMDKSHFVLFKRKQRILQTRPEGIILSDVELKREHSTKFLGVHMDESLSWNVHVDTVLRKIAKYIPILYNIRRNLTAESLKLIYNSLIYPNIMYCNSVWGACCDFRLRPLKVMQKKLVRVISFESPFHHTKELFEKLNILNLDKINKYVNLLYTFKKLQVNSGEFLIQTSCYSTRSSQIRSIALPNIVSAHSRQSVVWRGASLWNGLPEEIRQEQSYSTFKRKLKKLLIESDLM